MAPRSRGVTAVSHSARFSGNFLRAMKGRGLEFLRFREFFWFVGPHPPREREMVFTDAEVDCAQAHARTQRARNGGREIENAL